MTLKGNSVLLSLAVICCVSVSCMKMGEPDVSESRQIVTFVLNESQTRASVTPFEGNVTSLDVLVFRSLDGLLEGSAHSYNGGAAVSSVIVELGKESQPLEWYVLANVPEGKLSSFVRKADFLKAVTEITDGTERSLIMVGSGVFPEGAVYGTVPVSLKRYACKVTVESLTVKWPDAFRMATEVRLGRIALVNVVGSTPYSGIPTVGEIWYNKMGIDSGLSPLIADLTVKDYGILLSDEVPFRTESPLYCMPNPTANDVTSSNTTGWSARNTRIAVEILLDGSSNWYPIDLPAMACNRHYIIRSLTLTGPGSSGPDKPVERDDVRYSVAVESWEDGEVITVFQ